jgi:cysteine desulfurase/selenocysteine lyase
VAWQTACYTLTFRQGCRILTSNAEYAANYVAFLQVVRRHAVAINGVLNDAIGALDVDALEQMIDGRVTLIAIRWVPTNGGPTNPAAAVGKIARA